MQKKETYGPRTSKKRASQSQENEQNRGVVEISCGTLFKVREDGKETERIDVITDIGKGDIFSSSRLFEDTEGRYFCYMVGTAESKLVARIVGQLSFRETAAMARLGNKKFAWEFTNEDLDSLRSNFAKGKRLLMLKR